MRQTYIDLNLNHKTLSTVLSRRGRFDNPLQNNTWAFSGRLPLVDKKLMDNIKNEIPQFWHFQSRVSLNANDVLKVIIGNQDCTPHPKHFLEWR
jgi:hypothetical protein